MNTSRWESIKQKKLSPDQIDRIRHEAQREVAVMTLRELRQAAGKTQQEVAAITEVVQAELSQFERREDHKLSALRRYVQALGGEIEVSALINGKRVVLAGV